MHTTVHSFYCYALKEVRTLYQDTRYSVRPNLNGFSRLTIVIIIVTIVTIVIQVLIVIILLVITARTVIMVIRIIVISCAHKFISTLRSLR